LTWLNIASIALGEDIFATACSLRKRGFIPLTISANYYDDLGARFDFPPGLLNKMKDANVLYDRDESGEFFQMYSGNFAGGLFFEILQRIGYSGYGAPNAPFRIAAQKRRLHPKGMPRR
jgi:4-hydroxyphenylpyruvate dioxygenase